MAWKVSCVMDERLKFVAEYLDGNESMAALCRKYGISRRVGYKWLNRYEAEGVKGLDDRSRAPHHHPNAVDAAIEDAVITMKRKYMDLGPKKIRTKLEEAHPEMRWPAPSTIGDILGRNALVVRRRRRHHASPSSRPLEPCEKANEVWSVDFKGWFYTLNRRRCTPLTMSDGFTRYFLRCQGMSSSLSYEYVRPLMDACFREYGLPDRIRTDNGPPFATTGAGGLSRLAVWWIKLGIMPERIEPGHPEQNGRHERLHRTLKQATLMPPARTLRAQQAAFDVFRIYYNEERPHEALGQKTPASLYRPSQKTYPRRLAKPDYPSNWLVRKIRTSGCFKWQGREVYLSQTLVGEPVGFAPRDDGLWCVHFMQVPLGLFDERRRICKPLSRRK